MPSRILTFGDICSAIAAGELAAANDGSVYKINALELRRYFNKIRPLPFGMPVDITTATSRTTAPKQPPPPKPSTF